MIRLTTVLLACIGLLLIAPAAAHAQTITTTFDNPTLSGNPGDTFTVTGTVTNNQAQDVVFTTASAIVSGPAGPGVSADATPFLLNSPLTLAGNTTSGSFSMVDVVINPGAAPGLYTGTLQVFGTVGQDPTEVLLGESTFTIEVRDSESGSTNAPEPGGLLLLLSALPALGYTARRRQGGRAAPG